MKRLWTNDDLVVPWSLQPDELALAEYREDANRLDVARLLKGLACSCPLRVAGSDDAERDSREVKLFAFLNEQLRSPAPERYAALITEMRNFGFFVDVTGLGLSGLISAAQSAQPVG